MVTVTPKYIIACTGKNNRTALAARILVHVVDMA